MEKSGKRQKEERRGKGKKEKRGKGKNGEKKGGKGKERKKGGEEKRRRKGKKTRGDWREGARKCQKKSRFGGQGQAAVHKMPVVEVGRRAAEQKLSG